ncbi:hypothetical protein ACILG0_03000 [Pseudomonadota bacterium AL_CKDN230030165-1A_HGKHYDSX7]
MNQIEKSRVRPLSRTLSRPLLAASLTAAMVFGASAVQAQGWQPPSQGAGTPTQTYQTPPAPQPGYQTPAPQPGYQNAPAAPQPGYQSAPPAPQPGYQAPPPPRPGYQPPPPPPAGAAAPMGAPAPAPVALPGDPPQWHREDVTAKQRYETARKEAVNGYDESRKQCRTLAAAERKGCEAEARRNYNDDLAALKRDFGNK